VTESNRLLVFDTSPLEGLRPVSKGEILDDLAVAKDETIGKSCMGLRVRAVFIIY